MKIENCILKQSEKQEGKKNKKNETKGKNLQTQRKFELSI